MSGTWGNHYKISIFGESHGKAVGVVIDGLPAGFKIDENELKRQMGRRAPGGLLDTQRVEADQVRLISGYWNGCSTGSPLCAVVENTGQHSDDYVRNEYVARPGHADYTAHVKYKGYEDFRGGGHFSGRITLGLVIAGAIARQVLADKGIIIGGHIQKIADVWDRQFDPVSYDAEELIQLGLADFPVLDSDAKERMTNVIQRAKEAGDSVGGIIECKAVGLPAGLGDPFFDSLESTISHLAFSVPAVKGIEFGIGFGFSDLTGSRANDAFYLKEGNIKTKSNNNGGLNGGITNGMPIVFRTVLKPTPSIFMTQDSVDLYNFEEKELNIKGRHDPCVVRRGVPVLESILAISLMEHLGNG